MYFYFEDHKFLNENPSENECLFSISSLDEVLTLGSFITLFSANASIQSSQNPSYPSLKGLDFNYEQPLSKVIIFSTSSGFLESLKEKPLFATILERLEQQNSNKKEKWTILASLFASQVSIVLNEKTVRENFVRLTFESSDKDLLSSLKQNLSSLKLNHLLSDTEKLNVQIPFEIIKQLDDVKRFLESLGSEASEENFSALQACYKFTREQISSKLP